MKRKEFLTKLGIGAAFVLTVPCLSSCTKDKDPFLPETGTIDFTIDLDAANNAPLGNEGGFVIRQGIVIAKTLDGDFVAATEVCSHEGNKEIIFKDEEWFCTRHDARFDLNGNGLNKLGENGLTIYKTALNGNLLRVFT